MRRFILTLWSCFICLCLCFAEEVVNIKDVKKDNSETVAVNITDEELRCFDNVMAMPLYKPAASGLFNAVPEPSLEALKMGYESARSQAVLGNVLWISGTIISTAGMCALIVAINSDETNENLGRAGALAFIAGDLMVCAGVPIAIIGSIRKGRYYRAINRYEKNTHSYNEDLKNVAPHLQLNLHGNGLGLAFVF